MARKLLDLGDSISLVQIAQSTKRPRRLHLRFESYWTWTLVRITQSTKRPRRPHLRFELNIANECYFGMTVTQGHGAIVIELG